jgi:hypothetical protein
MSNITSFFNKTKYFLKNNVGLSSVVQINSIYKQTKNKCISLNTLHIIRTLWKKSDHLQLTSATN